MKDMGNSYPRLMRVRGWELGMLEALGEKNMHVSIAHPLIFGDVNLLVKEEDSNKICPTTV